MTTGTSGRAIMEKTITRWVILELVARHQLQHKGNAIHVFIHKFYFAMAETIVSSERRGLEENGVGKELQKN